MTSSTSTTAAASKEISTSAAGMADLSIQLQNLTIPGSKQVKSYTARDHPLGLIPGELRNRIHNDVLQDSTPIKLLREMPAEDPKDSFVPQMGVSARSSVFPGLTQEIDSLAADAYYHKQTSAELDLRLPNSVAAVRAWLETDDGLQQARHFREMKVHYYAWTFDPDKSSWSRRQDSTLFVIRDDGCVDAKDSWTDAARPVQFMLCECTSRDIMCAKDTTSRAQETKEFVRALRMGLAADEKPKLPLLQIVLHFLAVVEDHGQDLAHVHRIQGLCRDCPGYEKYFSTRDTMPLPPMMAGQDD